MLDLPWGWISKHDCFIMSFPIYSFRNSIMYIGPHVCVYLQCVSVPMYGGIHLHRCVLRKARGVCGVIVLIRTQLISPLCGCRVNSVLRPVCLFLSAVTRLLTLALLSWI